MDTIDLTKQKACVDKFVDWFESGGTGENASNEQGSSFREMIDDARRRYRMQLDQTGLKRKNNKLSSLPSTKSMSITDHAVEQFLDVYHGEPDALSYTAYGITDEMTEKKVQWLSKIFEIRSKKTAKLFTWHRRSLQQGLIDGIECAMTYWVKESYIEPEKYYIQGMEATKDEADMFSAIAPQEVQVIPEQEIILRDTFWIDSLMPGHDIFWDPEAPLADIQLGRWALVKLMRNCSQLESLAQAGILDLFDAEQMDNYHGTSDAPVNDDSRISQDPSDNTKLVELWCFFYKCGFRWKVQFSAKGAYELSSFKSVDEVFWGGKLTNLIPVVVGYSNPTLWESFGRGIPMDIASLEDEYSNNRNNLQDAANRALQKKYLIQRGSDVDINQLIHMPAVYAEPGEVTEMSTQVSMLESLRATDALQSDISEIAPAGVMSRGRSIVPNGTDQTLGALQMTMQDSGGKLNAMLRTRNETFLEPLLYRIGKLIQIFETDQTLMRTAANKVGFNPQILMDPQGRMMIDPRQLDMDFEVSINAGMGHIPKFQKSQILMQMVDWRISHQIPTDINAAARQLMVLAGLDPDMYNPKEMPPPPQPQVDYKLNIDMPAVLLPPEAQQFLMQKMINGEMNVTTKVDGDPSSRANERLQQQMAQRTGIFGTAPAPVDMAAQAASAGGTAPPQQTGAMNAPPMGA